MLFCKPSRLGEGSKIGNSRKWFGEGAKGLLDPGSKGLPRVSCTFRNLFCTGATLFCTSARGFSLPGSKRPFADSKRGRWKGATSKTSKIVKKCQKVFRHFSTIFAQGKKTSKIAKKCQKVFRHFSTIFARHLFSGPFCNPLKKTFAPSRNHFREFPIFDPLSQTAWFAIVAQKSKEMACHERHRQ